MKKPEGDRLTGVEVAVVDRRNDETHHAGRCRDGDTIRHTCEVSFSCPAVQRYRQIDQRGLGRTFRLID